MIKYRCPRCNVEFFHEKVNINHKHSCGEFAFLEWGTEYRSIAERKAREEG